MAIKKVGKLDSWSDADLGSTDFFSLDEGENLLRAVTSPYQFYIHWTKDATGQSRKVRCALENCPVCQRGEKPQPRWYIGILSRKTKAPAILDMGPQIFRQIFGLSKKASWGDPRKYDIDITKNPKGTQPLYVVQPLPKEELTKEEKTMLKTFLERCDLSKMVEPPSVEEINSHLGLETKTVAKSEKAAPEAEDDFVDTEAADNGSDDDFNFDT